MAQRLAHDVEIQEICVGAQFFQYQPKSFFGYSHWGSLGSGAEAAVQITHIGYFQIDLLKPLHRITPLRDCIIHNIT